MGGLGSLCGQKHMAGTPHELEPKGIQTKEAGERKTLLHRLRQFLENLKSAPLNQPTETRKGCLMATEFLSRAMKENLGKKEVVGGTTLRSHRGHRTVHRKDDRSG